MSWSPCAEFGIQSAHERRQPSGTATLLEMRMFDFSRPGLRVFSEFDSEMQWFESSRPKRTVCL
jgi:hypothetical protein